MRGLLSSGYCCPISGDSFHQSIEEKTAGTELKTVTHTAACNTTQNIASAFIAWKNLSAIMK